MGEKTKINYCSHRYLILKKSHKHTIKKSNNLFNKLYWTKWIYAFIESKSALQKIDPRRPTTVMRPETMKLLWKGVCV